MDIYSMTGEFEYPTSSQPVLGYLNPMGKNPGYWSIFSWIQSYIHECTCGPRKVEVEVYLYCRSRTYSRTPNVEVEGELKCEEENRIEIKFIYSSKKPV